MVAAVLLMAAFAWSLRPSGTEHSIAVLPFADLSPEGDRAYFADGIPEEVRYSLGP